MSVDNGVFRKALRPCGSDVVLVELFKHGSADHAGEDRGQAEPESNGRQDEMQQKTDKATVTGSGDGKPAERDRENEDEDRADGEVGEGQTDEGYDAERAVLPTAAMQRGPDAGWDGEPDADQQCRQGEDQSVRVALQDEV